MSVLSIKRLDLADFVGLQGVWVELLEDSAADQLFCSWAWQYHWWTTWEQVLDAELMLLAVYDENQRLLSISPFYFQWITVFKIFRYRRLQLVGNNFKSGKTVVSDYNSLIIRSGYETVVGDAIFSHLDQYDWSELVFNHIDEKAANSAGFTTGSHIRGWYCREYNQLRTVCVDTIADYSDYLASLGASTRGRLFNSRERAAEGGVTAGIC